MPSTMMAPWARLMTFMTPQMSVNPMAARPYTEPTRTPSITEAMIPIMWGPRAGGAFNGRRRKGVASVNYVGSLGLLRPDHFLGQLSIFLLPLRKHHLMRDLEAMLVRIGGELGAAEERRDVDLVEHCRHLVGLDRTG